MDAARPAAAKTDSVLTPSPKKAPASHKRVYSEGKKGDKERNAGGAAAATTTASGGGGGGKDTLMKGYKKRADGSTTSYFDVERSAEVLEMIGDIAPKKIDKSKAEEIEREMKVCSSFCCCCCLVVVPSLSPPPPPLMRFSSLFTPRATGGHCQHVIRMEQRAHVRREELQGLGDGDFPQAARPPPLLRVQGWGWFRNFRCLCRCTFVSPFFDPMPPLFPSPSPPFSPPLHARPRDGPST